MLNNEIAQIIIGRHLVDNHQERLWWLPGGENDPISFYPVLNHTHED